MEARFRSNKHITVKDFEQEIEFLKRTGKMPTLDQVLRTMAEARQEYRGALSRMDCSEAQIIEASDQDGFK